MPYLSLFLSSRACVEFFLVLFQSLLFGGAGDVQAVNYLDISGFIEIFGKFRALVEIVHFDGVPGTDFLVQSIFGFGAYQFELKFLWKLALFKRGF